MAGLRDLKRRIKSIGGTRKITRAMQMVSAAKMRKAQAAVLASRTYSSLAWELINNLTPVIARSASDEAILTNDRIASTFAEASADRSDALAMTHTYPKAQKVGVIILGSNRGLVGSLNSNLGKLLEQHSVVRPFMGSSPDQKADKSADYKEQAPTSELVVYGKKAKQLAQRTKYHILADFEKTEKTLTAEDIFPLAKFISDAYATGKYKSIVIIYNHYVSTIAQKPTVKQLLPFSGDNLVGTATGRPQSGPSGQPVAGPTEKHEVKSDYLFEPTPSQVLEHLIPRIIESQLYQTILESDASEHSARMVMMKNATEAAGDLIHHYTLSYNQLRQNKITTELAEITAGKIALE